MGSKTRRLEKLAAAEVAAVMAALPAPLAGSARQVPVVFEALPDPGEDPDGDLLGLFVGAEIACEGDDPMPPHIVLFLENLWDEAGCNPRVFRNEVRVTYLHELGHYLGFGEGDLSERGLE